MFEVGWTEMLVIAVVMIVVVGPKDLPRMLRTFGRTTAKLRSMAGDFQKQFNEALREAELDDVKKSVDDLRKLNPATEIKKQLNPFEKAAADVRAGLDSAMKPAAPKPAAPAAPLTNGSAAPTSSAEAAKPAEPIVAGPTEMPKPPVFAEPASPVVHAAEPLKNGATVMPGETKPSAKAAKAKAPAKAAKVPTVPAKAAQEKPAPAKPAAAKKAAPAKAAPAKTVAAAKPAAAKKKSAGKTS